VAGLLPVYRCRGRGVYVEDPSLCPEGAVLVLTPEQRLRLSKLMSALLRHIPHEAGLRLDEEGWVEVAELARAIRERWRNRVLYSFVRPEHIIAVAATDKRGRFQLSPDGRRIRASYGHSVGVKLGYRSLPWSEVPRVLYHGTVRRNLGSIMEKGLLPMRRLMVHLAANRETAVEVGRRHGRDVVVLLVDTECLRRHGIPVYRASPVIYLAERVPPDCIRVEQA
jgi:putative RNA 2'-phosphotransferase